MEPKIVEGRIPVRVTVSISFGDRERQVFASEAPPVRVPVAPKQEQRTVVPPYRMPSSTAPEEPVLIASGDFVSFE